MRRHYVDYHPLNADTKLHLSRVDNQREQPSQASKLAKVFVDPHLLVISDIARKKQQIETQLAPSRQMQAANEFVRVSSSIAGSRYANNLNHQQATSLYKEIGAMISSLG